MELELAQEIVLNHGQRYGLILDLAAGEGRSLEIR